MVKRVYDNILAEKLKSNRILLAKGPKNSQKASYIASIIETFSAVQIVNCEDKKIKQAFSDAEKSPTIPPKSSANVPVPELSKTAPVQTDGQPVTTSKSIKLVDLNQGSIRLLSGE